MTDIIILNGTPSAGKSSIARALQDQLPHPYLLVGIDLIASTLPERYLESPLCNEVIAFTEEGSELVAHPGALGDKLVSGLHYAVAALVEVGHRVIIDHALIKSGWVLECARLFRQRNVLFVGVRCPLEVIERREQDRADRRAGTARAQFHAVHAGKVYDVEVNTATNSASDCARDILRHVGMRAASRLFDAGA